MALKSIKNWVALQMIIENQDITITNWVMFKWSKVNRKENMTENLLEINLQKSVFPYTEPKIA